MPIWQLCANLLIPNCLRSNLSYSPLAALELYVMEPKAMGFEMKVKTICRPLLFIFDSTCLQYFGIRWNAMGKPDVTTNHGAVTNSDPP